MKRVLTVSILPDYWDLLGGGYVVLGLDSGRLWESEDIDEDFGGYS